MAYYYVQINDEEIYFAITQNETQWDYGRGLSLTKYINDFAAQSKNTIIHVLLDQRYCDADAETFVFSTQTKTIAGIDRNVGYSMVDNIQDDREFFHDYTQPLPFVLIGTR